MRRQRCLAAAQTVPAHGDVAANVESHLQLARLAAEAGAQVALFPELSLTGYEIPQAPGLAFSPDDARLAPLRAAAATGRLMLVVGAPLRLGAQLHVGALALRPDGGVDVYTKHHLGAFSSDAAVDGSVPPAEHSVFAPGNRSPLLAIGGDTAALAVCADTSRPSHPQAAVDRGATLYLASVFSIPSAYDRESANLAAHARRHGLTVVMANFGGPTGGLAAAGGSAIWSSDGSRVGQLPARGAGVLVAREDTDGWSARTAVLDVPASPSTSPAVQGHGSPAAR